MHYLRAFAFTLLTLAALSGGQAFALISNWERLLAEDATIRWLSQNSPHLKAVFQTATDDVIDRLGPVHCIAVLRAVDPAGEGRSEALYERLLAIRTKLGGNTGPGQLRRAAEALMVDPASTASRWDFLPDSALRFNGVEPDEDLFTRRSDPFGIAELAIEQWVEQEARFRRNFTRGSVTLSQEAQILSVGATYKQFRLAAAAVLDAYLSATNESELNRARALALEMEQERIRFPLDHYMVSDIRFRVSAVKAKAEQALVVLKSILLSTAKIKNPSPGYP